MKPRPTLGEGLATYALLAHVVTNKYLLHLPLHRQHQMFLRYGINLTTSTLGGWTGNTADALIPVYDMIGYQVLQAYVLQTDDTGVCVLDKNHKKGSKRGHLWGYLGGPLFYYEYTPDWRAEHPRKFLESRIGWLVTDGYKGYDFDARGPNGQIIRAGCWSHARRYFEHALTQNKLASVSLHYIGQLYEIEKRAKTESLSHKAI